MNYIKHRSNCAIPSSHMDAPEAPEECISTVTILRLRRFEKTTVLASNRDMPEDVGLGDLHLIMTKRNPAGGGIRVDTGDGNGFGLEASGVHDDLSIGAAWREMVIGQGFGEEKELELHPMGHVTTDCNLVDPAIDICREVHLGIMLVFKE